MPKKKRSFRGPMERLAGKRGWLLSHSEGRQGPVSHDLFGWCDAVALDGTHIIGIQFTDRSNLANRLTKMLGPASECRSSLINWLASGGLVYVMAFPRVKDSDDIQGTVKVIEVTWDNRGELIQCQPVVWDFEF